MLTDQTNISLAYIEYSYRESKSWINKIIHINKLLKCSLIRNSIRIKVFECSSCVIAYQIVCLAPLEK